MSWEIASRSKGRSPNGRSSTPSNQVRAQAATESAPDRTRLSERSFPCPKTAVSNAKLGRDEKLATLKRLDNQARMLEGAVEEFAVHSYGGEL